MRRGRDDERVMGPLFPRLHVNDADKGGPRAPPRNKMALYELFTIPSQKFNSDAAATPPKLAHQAGSLVPSAFSSQGGGHVRSVFSPFPASHIPVHMAEKVHTHSLGGINHNATSMGLERKSSKQGSQRMANSAGNVQMGAKCSSLHPDDLSSVKGPFGKESGGEDDFRVPTCVLPGIILCSDKDHHSLDREGTTHCHLNSPQKNGATAFSSQGQVQGSHGKPLERDHTNSSMQRHESSNEGKAEETVTLHMSMKDSISHSALREKVADPSKVHRPSSNEEHPSCKLNDLNTSQGESVRQCEESHGSFGEARCLNDDEFMEKQLISNGRIKSCSKMSLDRSLVEPSIVEHCDFAIDKATGAEGAGRTGSPEDANKNETEDADRNDDVSETSIVDSIPGVDISPDDVVGLIGPKHFWKVRRAIVNQQRVFAVQVFELHRLIKVQKLIAESPHLLLEDTYLHSSPKAPVKDPSASFLAKAHLQIKQKNDSHMVNNSDCATENTESANLVLDPRVKIVKQKDESHKATCNGECAPENTGGNLPLPHEHGKGPMRQLPRDGTCSGRASSFPASSDHNSDAWCFHPPGNQWLIPVMSPSEGLIYKPYTGPCPPTGALMVPVYSGCGPPSAPSVAGDLMKPAFGLPVPHLQPTGGVLPGAAAVAPNYFPAPYGLPVVNPLISSSPVEQVRSMAGPRTVGQREQHSGSSCSMSNTRREAASECTQKLRIAEEHYVQGSTASCAGNRSRGDALPKFPMASSSVECSARPPRAHSSRGHRTRVIKVVPHNAQSATESAARIFRSIQRERRQHDSV